MAAKMCIKCNLLQLRVTCAKLSRWIVVNETLYCLLKQLCTSHLTLIWQIKQKQNPKIVQFLDVWVLESLSSWFSSSPTSPHALLSICWRLIALRSLLKATQTGSSWTCQQHLIGLSSSQSSSLAGLQ